MEKNKHYFLYLWLLFAVIFFSCEKDACINNSNDDGPEINIPDSVTLNCDSLNVLLYSYYNQNRISNDLRAYFDGDELSIDKDSMEVLIENFELFKEESIELILIPYELNTWIQNKSYQEFDGPLHITLQNSIFKKEFSYHEEDKNYSLNTLGADTFEICVSDPSHLINPITLSIKLEEQKCLRDIFLETVTEENNKGNISQLYLPIIRLDSQSKTSIEGKITGEKDLTNSEPESFSNVEISAFIDFENSELFNNPYDLFYGGLTHDNFFIMKKKFGHITKATSNDSGDFTLLLPYNIEQIPVKIQIDDFVIEQTLLMNSKDGSTEYGIQEVKTLFGTELTDDNEKYAGYPSDIPVVPPAYCIIEEPLNDYVVITDSMSVIELTIINNKIKDTRQLSKDIQYDEPFDIVFLCNGSRISTKPFSEFDAVFEFDSTTLKYYVEDIIIGISTYSDISIPVECMQSRQTAVGLPRVSSSGRITGVSFVDTTGYFVNLTSGYGYANDSPPEVEFFPTVPGHGSNAKGVVIVNRKGYLNMVVIQDGGTNYTGKNAYVPEWDETNTGDYPGSGQHVSYSSPSSDSLSHSGNYFSVNKGTTTIKNIFLGTGLRLD